MARRRPVLRLHPALLHLSVAPFDPDLGRWGACGLRHRACGRHRAPHRWPCSSGYAGPTGGHVASTMGHAGSTPRTLLAGSHSVIAVRRRSRSPCSSRPSPPRGLASGCWGRVGGRPAPATCQRPSAACAQPIGALPPLERHAAPRHQPRWPQRLVGPRGGQPWLPAPLPPLPTPAVYSVPLLRGARSRCACGDAAATVAEPGTPPPLAIRTSCNGPYHALRVAGCSTVKSRVSRRLTSPRKIEHLRATARSCRAGASAAVRRPAAKSRPHTVLGTWTRGTSGRHAPSRRRALRGASAAGMGVLSLWAGLTVGHHPRRGDDRAAARVTRRRGPRRPTRTPVQYGLRRSCPGSLLLAPRQRRSGT